MKALEKYLRAYKRKESLPYVVLNGHDIGFFKLSKAFKLIQDGKIRELTLKNCHETPMAFTTNFAFDACNVMALFLHYLQHNAQVVTLNLGAEFTCAYAKHPANLSSTGYIKFLPLRHMRALRQLSIEVNDFWQPKGFHQFLTFIKAKDCPLLSLKVHGQLNKGQWLLLKEAICVNNRLHTYQGVGEEVIQVMLHGKTVEVKAA